MDEMGLHSDRLHRLDASLYMEASYSYYLMKIIYA